MWVESLHLIPPRDCRRARSPDASPVRSPCPKSSRYGLASSTSSLSTVSRESSDELVTAGVADAVALGPDGEIDAVIDWKSDVAPTPEIVGRYQAQGRAYLDALNFGRGLIVFVTTGQVISVSR